jgi:hypothetical protein
MRRRPPGAAHAIVEIIAQTVVDNQVMRHPDPVRLHRVPEVVDIVADVGIVKVGHAPGVGRRG